MKNFRFIYIINAHCRISFDISVYYNYTSVFSDLVRSILNLHRHFKYVKKLSNEKFLDIRELDENFLTYYKIPRYIEWYNRPFSSIIICWFHPLSHRHPLILVKSAWVFKESECQSSEILITLLMAVLQHQGLTSVVSPNLAGGLTLIMNAKKSVIHSPNQDSTRFQHWLVLVTGVVISTKHWFYFLTVVISTKHWFYFLTVVISTKHWFYFLTVVISTKHWFYFLTVVISTKHWFYFLTVVISTKHWLYFLTVVISTKHWLYFLTVVILISLRLDFRRNVLPYLMLPYHMLIQIKSNQKVLFKVGTFYNNTT